MEKHFHGGMTPEEASELGLRARDYTPHRLEERIVIYADRLVDIITDGFIRLRDEREAEERFEEIVRKHPKYGKNPATLERYLGYHREIQGLIGEKTKGAAKDCKQTCPISKTETIVLVTDGTVYGEGAIREAIRFAAPCSSKIVAVMSFESNPEYETVGVSAYDALVADGQRHLATIKERAGQAGVACETVLHTDLAPQQAIVREAAERNANVIFIGRRGWRGVAKALMGEVAAKVIGHAPCKVLVVPRAAQIGYRHILVAVDGSPHSEEALHEAVAIAKRCNSSLLALSTMRDESERAEAQGHVARAVAAAQQEGVQAEGVTPTGRSFDAIVETAGGRSVDLIVMGAYGKTGIRKAIMGSATENVIGNAGCAVLVVQAKAGEGVR
jgi:nucleotide-binding universal stress UspA family protein